MTTVQQLLDEKGHNVWTIQPDATVLDAIESMALKDIGALAVVEDKKLAGIITERIYARNVILEGKASRETPVRDVMATNVACVTPSKSVGDCMVLLTNNRVRHLPVLEDGELVGLISIGDLLHSMIKDQENTIDSLEGYIYEDSRPFRQRGEA